MSAIYSLPEGIRHWPQYLDETAQIQLLETIREKVVEAPLFVPKMPRTGKEMSVRMTNFGALGWVTDKERGYRYQKTHPKTGRNWPLIPQQLLDAWEELSGYEHPPEACLINFYSNDAKMGMHQDRDEDEFGAPVLSLSLGNECRFRVGGIERGGKTSAFILSSGDAMMLSGPARLAYHGVDKIIPQSSQLLKAGGRINITMRRVTKPV